MSIEYTQTTNGFDVVTKIEATLSAEMSLSDEMLARFPQFVLLQCQERLKRKLRADALADLGIADDVRDALADVRQDVERIVRELDGLKRDDDGFALRLVERLDVIFERAAHRIIK